MNFYTKLSGCRKVNLYKFLLVMRFTLILIFVGMLQVSAKSYGQQFTLNQKSISIKQIFKEIKVQTGYDILWQPDKLDGSQKINAHFNSAPLSQVINECIAGHNLVFEIQDQSIVLKSAPIKMKFEVPQDSVIFKGKITDENGKPMTGATLRIIGSTKSTFTNSLGNFSIYGPLKGMLEVSYIGYQNKQLTLNGLDPLKLIKIMLVPGTNNLGEVSVVSTGYQDIAKERATGSFESITKEQLQHSSDPNLIRRLEGITTSMNFNNQLTPINSATASVVGLNGQYVKSPATTLTIRGKNTLVQGITSSNTTGQVLVVIDGIASPYSIDRVDPNDVESITVLKDAAAASIWGSQAANGVIVVKTKRGNYDKPVQVSFNTNFNVTEKLNLFYKKYATTSEYIDAQIFQFNASNTSIGAPTISQPQPFYSPVAEILNQQKQGQLTLAQSNSQLDRLRGNDIRKDYDKYILRDAFTQSYSLAIDGGSKKVAYRVSGAYNNTLNNTVGSNLGRLTLNYNISVRPIKNLELLANVNYSQQTSTDQSQNNAIRATVGAPYYQYTRLVDDSGNPTVIPFKYRTAFVDLIATTYGDKVLDLHFNPLQDMNEGYLRTNSKNLNLNLITNYKIDGVFSLNIQYNYSRGNAEQDQLSRQNSFYTRDLITSYTAPSNYSDPVLGPQPYYRQIPLGGIYSPMVSQSINQTLRGQFTANKSWTEKHVLNAIAGIDVTQNYALNKNNQYYGYNENTLASNNQLNYGYLTSLFNVSGSNIVRIPYLTSFSDFRVRTYSLFANAAYTYNKLYTISSSIRKDVSSQFGPSTNKGGSPFYSLGGKWNIAGESFYDVDFIPRLQLRTTFGYNGNVNPGVNSQPLITYATGTATNGLSYASVQSGATNSLLRPEKTAIVNLGLDFGLRNNRLSGSFEYYDKHTTDLLAVNPVDPSTGYNRQTFNVATLHTWGTDLTLNSLNLQGRMFSWTTNFLFSYNRVKVAKLFAAAAQTAGQVVVGTPVYNEGYDLTRLFAFKWAGLDPVTGDPRGYVNGQPYTVANTANYSTVANQVSSAGARYFGSAVPVYYGSLRNTFNYGAFSISANLLYKLGYYFKRPSSDMVRYYEFLNTNTVLAAEYSQRWQKPGDEVHTNVPSLIYPGNSERDIFYWNSEINVQKGDHIRLQEVNLSYTLSKKTWFIKNPRIYCNVSNLGVIWRANKLGLDPDINDYPNPRTYSLGFNANF